jgi:hypothetical protein
MHRNNARLGVTRILLYVKGNFFRVLEGRPADVSQIYEKVAWDKRRMRVTQIISESISRRSFTEWSMGFLSMSQEQLGEIVGARDFFDWHRTLQPMLNGRARKLMEAFYEGRWRTRIPGISGIPAVPGTRQPLVEPA